MKTAKKIFKIVGIILGIIILALIGYIIYLFASYHRIEDNLPLEVESHAADAELTTEKEYSALTYNIGFGAYTPDFSFFMAFSLRIRRRSRRSTGRWILEESQRL